MKPATLNCLAPQLPPARPEPVGSNRGDVVTKVAIEAEAVSDRFAAAPAQAKEASRVPEPATPPTAYASALRDTIQFLADLKQKGEIAGAAVDASIGAIRGLLEDGVAPPPMSREAAIGFTEIIPLLSARYVATVDADAPAGETKAARDAIDAVTACANSDIANLPPVTNIR